MARSLIAVVSCHGRKEWQEAIRRTWLPLVPEGTDVRFFIGRGDSDYSPSEVVLDCDDSYQGLPEKVQCIAKWAIAEGYDYMLKLDDDVVIYPALLLASGYEANAFTGADGHRPNPQRPYFVPSGFAYWLNRTCMEIIAAEPLPNDNYDEGWVAGTLYKYEATLTCDPRYYVTVCRTLPSIDRRVVPGRVATRIRREPVPGTFAWCIYFEPNGGTKYSTIDKIKEFNRVFAVEVAAKK
jgi:Galactosyltransferase